jgi:hypothetical protein
MDARERSFLEEAQRHRASGRDLDALVRISFVGDAVRIEEFPHGVTNYASLLYYASLHGWCAAVNWLLEQGADVHVGCPLHGGTPLQIAANIGLCDVAVLLFDAGARVNDCDKSWQTALHYAASHGCLKMCQLLVSRGARLDARDTAGYSPKAYARRYGKTTTADFLAAVSAKGGWRAYCDAPFLDLRRELRAPGAIANSSVGLYQRVFVELPNDVFPRVLAFRPDF